MTIEIGLVVHGRYTSVYGFLSRLDEQADTSRTN